MKNFANETPEERAAAFDEAAARLGMTPGIVEKDFWVCWTLETLFSSCSFRKHLIFKGGTSLSKAYDAIKRFSEDIDLSLDRSQLGFIGDRDPAAHSGKRQKELFSELEQAAGAYVSGPVLRELHELFSAELDQAFTLDCDPDNPQTLLFSYPTLSAAGGYVRPVVRLEFGARGVLLPAEARILVPDVERAITGLIEFPEAKVTVLGIERTFWEKATILHMLAHRDSGKALPDRMSRHYYDMAMLARHEARTSALSQTDLLQEVAHHKAVWFRAAWARYDEAKPGSLKLMPGAELEAALRADYAGMREMIVGDVPDFNELLADISALEREINAIRSAV